MVKADHIGKYPIYDSAWNRTGEASDTPTYAGQQPQRFPYSMTPFECALAAHEDRQRGK